MHGLNKIWFATGFIILFIFIAFLLVPVIRFDKGYSTVVLAENGRLLGAKIAPDEQWRFPAPDSVSVRFKTALLTYEDKRFELHNGIDVLSLVRALWLNLRQGKIVSGGSTLTMQLARIYRSNPDRTLVNKLLEMGIAWKTEQILSKEEIFKMYMEHAPFGGNVVGLETASWRYYNKRSADLSWAEAATLAVLPNSPGLIHPGRNRDELHSKRNALLKKLFEKGWLDKDLYELSLLEELPDKPFPFPLNSIHLVEKLSRSGISHKIYRTSIDYHLHHRCEELANAFSTQYSRNGIQNLAVLVVENQTGKVLSYVGNTGRERESNHEFYVDMIQSGRSSGSILKPLLFAGSLDAGLITTGQLLPDIPGNINGYRPRNFDREFEGAVPANRALIRSLNVPMVYLLQEYTIDKFLYELQDIGFTTIDESAEHYGLPLILGGANVRLWDLVSVYSSVARTLQFYNETGTYQEALYTAPVFDFEGLDTAGWYKTRKNSPDHYSAGAIWQTLETMTQLERPDRSGNWDRYQNARRIAWKTGTSFKFKDAWSVGVSVDYTVGVWVGNATGEGRAGLTGIQVAAPVLFGVFDLLPNSSWFVEPADDLKFQEICKLSGAPPGPFCVEIDTILIPFTADILKICDYHRNVILDESGQWQITEDCVGNDRTIARNYFVLPPLMEHFYARKHPDYAFLPPLHTDCVGKSDFNQPMALIYPSNPTRIQIPIGHTGEPGRVVFRLAHRNRSAKVFWYIDNKLVNTTKEYHEIEFFRPEGGYQLLVLDDSGNRLTQRFRVVR